MARVQVRDDDECHAGIRRHMDKQPQGLNPPAEARCPRRDTRHHLRGHVPPGWAPRDAHVLSNHGGSIRSHPAFGTVRRSFEAGRFTRVGRFLNPL
jgi:hypothetical protein